MEQLIAQHYQTGQAVRLTVSNGRLTALENVSASPPPGPWLAPALVDLQVNGFGGVDFQQDNLTLEQLLHATAELRQAGCGGWLLTLITDEWGALLARLRHLRALRAKSELLQHSILGWHLEGPFLSVEPGYHGAHPAEFMLDPTPDRLRILREATGRERVLLTLAPERPAAIEAIALAVALGFKVSLGHTNASAEVLRAALQAGATGFTHFGNACPVALDRRDNILWRVLDVPGLTISLIPDGYHVSPALFRLAHRVFGADSVYYVSDAMAAAGAPPGRYTIGPLSIEVGPDQIVRKPGARQFAGSALRPLDGVFRAAAMLGQPWQHAWRHFSETPRAFLGLPSTEDWCLLSFDKTDGSGTEDLAHLRYSFWGGSGIPCTR